MRHIPVKRAPHGPPRVRISAAEDDDASSAAGGPAPLTTELSVEGSELSASSVASLAPLAPGGVRPPALGGGAVGVRWLGTSTKRVSWAEYAEVSLGGRGEGFAFWSYVTGEKRRGGWGEAGGPHTLYLMSAGHVHGAAPRSTSSSLAAAAAPAARWRP